MKPNTESGVSLPFGKHGEIRFAKTVARLSAKGLPFHGENFDILREKLRTMCGFQNVVVEPDDEDVAINIAFDLEVKGNVRNPEGLLRAVRKKLQRAMDQSYKCLYCLDQAPENCPECRKRKEAEQLGDYMDLKGELNRNDEEDEEEDIGEYWKSWSCDQCGEPWDECVCLPDDLDPGLCFQCEEPYEQCICVEEGEEKDD